MSIDRHRIGSLNTLRAATVHCASSGLQIGMESKWSTEDEGQSTDKDDRKVSVV